MSVIIHGLVLFVCVKCSIAEALQQETNSLKYNLKKKSGQGIWIGTDFKVAKAACH